MFDTKVMKNEKHFFFFVHTYYTGTSYAHIDVLKLPIRYAVKYDSKLLWGTKVPSPKLGGSGEDGTKKKIYLKNRNGANFKNYRANYNK